jgi:predicted hydrocarbon binding protein/KaiC/GvpD/RAD55 family RecA-like ATPase
VTLTKLHEPPDKGLILLAGVPGAGKSTFGQQVVLNGIAADKPVIFVTSERSPADVIDLLVQKGMSTSSGLSFVDAFSETVGLTVVPGMDTESANCADLNSLSIAITRVQERTGGKGILLVFDSLTSPYLLAGVEVVKFVRLFLSKFAAEGNSVLALVDEGCGREEDIGAMMSVADGLIRIEVKDSSRIISVMKHPQLAPVRIESPASWGTEIPCKKFDSGVDKELARKFFSSQRGGRRIRPETGDFVNVYWVNLASWSGMLWDPMRFPALAYKFDKEAESNMREYISMLLPRYMQFIFNLFLPESFREVRDMKKAASNLMKREEKFGNGIPQYLAEVSKKDEHYVRVYENPACWGFDNVGAGLDFHGCGMTAGLLTGLEKKGDEWNIIETKCIGLGDPYCEFKVVHGRLDELNAYLGAVDRQVTEKVYGRLMEHISGFLLDKKPLPERPRQGNDIWFHRVHHVTSLPALFSERYCMALRMGGTKVGREMGEQLKNAGVDGDEAIRRVIDFIDYCKAGKTILGETIKIKENCETFGLATGELSCFFTTGFLSGLFSAVKNRRIREIKCCAAGDPYCEWEII